MKECPLCEGVGELREKTVHFGDGIPTACICPACRGTGKVQGIPAGRSPIIVVKPHGVWRTNQ